MLVQLQERMEELDGELKAVATAVRKLLQANSLAEEPERGTTSVSRT
jgi:hypothetical protein